jgi:hypothetical protein
VLRFLGGLVAQYPDSVIEPATVNGGPGLRVVIDGHVDGAVSFSFNGPRIQTAYYVRNPEKLAALAAPVRLAR